MTERVDLSGALSDQRIRAVFQDLKVSADLEPSLQRVLDMAIALTRADMGTLQRFDDVNDCLHISASRGLPKDALSYFGTVRRDTNTTCAVALTRRMRVFVEDISTSYLFVSTPELDILRANGIAAAVSTPLISGSGRFWGVITTHFRAPQPDRDFDHSSLDQLAKQVAEWLEERENIGPTASRPADAI
jgi:GAF domain-containing protein